MIAGGYLKICCVESRKTCTGKNTALFTLELVRNLSGRNFSVKNEGFDFFMVSQFATKLLYHCFNVFA